MWWQGIINTYVALAHPWQVLFFFYKVGRLPNVAFPKRGHDKHLWRKIFDRNPEFTRLSDKLLVKEFAISRCPDLNVPETMWAGTDFDDIPDELLEEPTVLKSNHASGQVIFLDGKDIDRKAVKAETERWLAIHYGWKYGEWAYRNIERKIFLEKPIGGKMGVGFEELDMSIFGGKVRYFQVLRDSYGPRPTMSIYDREGRQIETLYNSSFETVHIDPPPQYDRVVRIAERLGVGFDHIRCDFYLHGDDIYFGEMAVYPMGGYPRDVAELRMAYETHWDLQQSWFLTTPQSGWKREYATWLRNSLTRDD